MVSGVESLLIPEYCAMLVPSTTRLTLLDVDFYNMKTVNEN